jgi:hypothetical protein
MEDVEFEKTVETAMKAYAEKLVIKDLDATIQRIVENRIEKLINPANRWSSESKINNMTFDAFVRVKTEKVIEDVIEKHIKEILAKKIAEVL